MARLGGTVAFDPSDVQRVEDMGERRIARELGVGVGTVRRVALPFGLTPV
jgi:hypothetical protein